jgi:hypothetical protein
VLIPPNDRYQLSILNIPLDDTNTMFHFIAWSEEKGIERASDMAIVQFRRVATEELQASRMS